MNKNLSIITGEGAELVGKTEEFKRPDHTDFMTAAELKKTEWSGVRENRITHRREIWILGEVVASLDIRMIARGSEGWDKLYRETFGLPNEVDEGDR